MPMMLVEKKCVSASMHVPFTRKFQYVWMGLHRNITPKMPQAAAPMMQAIRM
jgi:hypothetical protein